jgi:hypothetical protein
MVEVFFQTFIDIEKWDAARWKATAFFHDPSGAQPPYLGIVFDNIEAGRQIFSDWLQRLGSVDQYEELRISIVEGEILGEEPGYSVHLSSDPSHTEEHSRAKGVHLEVETAIVVSRFKRMTPAPESPYLPRFKQDVAKHKRFFLIPVSSEVKPEFGFAIEKTEIHFRRASEVAKADRDAVIFPEHYFDGDGAVH